jgi:hypothetical protein
LPNAESAVDLSRRLLGVVDLYVAKLPRDRKFTIGDRLLVRTITILETVTRSYYSPRSRKADLLTSVNVELEVLRQLLRFLFEAKVHDLRKHEHFSREIDELGRCVGGWIKSLRGSFTPDT